jgi:hypothetical protein
MLSALKWSAEKILIVETKSAVIKASRNVYHFALVTLVRRELGVMQEITEKHVLATVHFRVMVMPTVHHVSNSIKEYTYAVCIHSSDLCSHCF